MENKESPGKDGFKRGASRRDVTFDRQDAAEEIDAVKDPAEGNVFLGSIVDNETIQYSLSFPSDPEPQVDVDGLEFGVSGTFIDRTGAGSVDGFILSHVSNGVRINETEAGRHEAGRP